MKMKIFFSTETVKSAANEFVNEFFQVRVRNKMIHEWKMISDKFVIIFNNDDTNTFFL